MLKRITIGLVAGVAMNGTAHAYILIDDFTVGEYHKSVSTQQSHDSNIQENLDKAHSVFGRRTTDLSIDLNFNQVPIQIDVGGGVESVSYTSHSMATRLDTGFGFNGSFTVDFSQETRFYADVFSENPAHRFADQWSITAVDATGKDGGNGGALSWAGGIYFEKSGFSQNLDWSRIRYLEFTQKFSPDFGTVPLQYGVTSFYAVPEPSLVFPLLVGCKYLVRRARRPA